MIHVDFPFRFDGRGRTATTSWPEHVRDMIEQFLFTNPGERVNRPEFGSGLLAMVFEPNSPELAAALQHTVQAGLDNWLGDIIELRNVEVNAVEARLQVTVVYALRGSGEERVEHFERSTSP